MKKILSLLPIFTVIMLGLYNCKSRGSSILKQSLVETLSKGIVQHIHKKSREPETNRFISLIGNANVKVEFKRVERYICS